MLAISLFALLSTAHAETGERVELPGRAEVTTDRVVVFKNGHALFVKRARAQADSQGRIWTEELPKNAILGSFWASSDDAPLVGMHAEWVEETRRLKDTSDALTITELLEANQGERIQVKLRRQVPGEPFEGVTPMVSETEVLQGRLIDVLDRPRESPRPAGEPRLTQAGIEVRGLGARSDGPARTSRVLPRDGRKLMVMEVPDQGRRVVFMNEVVSLSGRTLKTQLVREVEEVTREKRLSFDLGAEQASKSVDVEFMYFAPGVDWVPTYRAELQSDGTAKLSLQGEVSSSVEHDLDGATFHLVAGVPHFQSWISPLSLEETLREAMVVTAPVAGFDNNTNFTNAVFHEPPRAVQPPEPAPSASEAPGDGDAYAAGGMHAYTTGRPHTLRSGARATMPLWTREVSWEQVQQLKLQLVRNPSDGRLVAGDEDVTRIWNSITLHNDSDMPWTSGSILFVEDGIPIGQDKLLYTAAGQTGSVKMNLAVNLRSDFTPGTPEALEGSRSIGRWSYRKFDVHDTLRLTNFRKRAVTIEVELQTGGKVRKAVGGGVIEETRHDPKDWAGRGHPRMNPHATVRWTVELMPGDSAELGYDVSFFTR